MAQKAKEYKLIPEYTQNFFIKAFDLLNGKIKKINNKELSIEQIPQEIKNIMNNNYKKEDESRKIKKISFDKQYSMNNNVEFVSFGHPLFESVLNFIEKNYHDLILTGAVFADPDGKLDGYIVYFEGEVKDGYLSSVGKQIFSYYINEKKEVQKISPTIIWDIVESGKENYPSVVDIDELKNKAIEFAIDDLTKYKEKILEERKRQAEIKIKYGKKSLIYLITKIDDELLDLEDRKNKGEDVALAIFNKTEKKNEYLNSLKELEDKIQKEQTINMDMPKFLGIIKVEPLVGKKKDIEIEKGMKSDYEIEKIGMQIAMKYEIEQGRNPVDVSSENLGYDIRSEDIKGNIRYIEVKARANVGEVSLTQNENFKAIRFGKDYYLYVIFNAAENPILRIINNPAETLNIETHFEQVRYIVDPDEIISKGLKYE